MVVGLESTQIFNFARKDSSKFLKCPRALLGPWPTLPLKALDGFMILTQELFVRGFLLIWNQPKRLTKETPAAGSRGFLWSHPHNGKNELAIEDWETQSKYHRLPSTHSLRCRCRFYGNQNQSAAPRVQEKPAERGFLNLIHGAVQSFQGLGGQWVGKCAKAFEERACEESLSRKIWVDSKPTTKY